VREYVALAGRIRQATADLERVVSRTEYLMEKAQRTGDDGYFDGAALNLHGFYVGVEHIFEDIAREMEENVPGDSGWHQSLLLQISADIWKTKKKAKSRTGQRSLDLQRLPGAGHGGAALRQPLWPVLNPQELRGSQVLTTDFTGDTDCKNYSAIAKV